MYYSNDLVRYHSGPFRERKHFAVSLYSGRYVVGSFSAYHWIIVLGVIAAIIYLISRRSPMARLRFKNPSNGYVEEVPHPGLWCLIFGCFYLGYKGAWGPAVIAFLLACVTFGLSWLIFPFFAKGLIRTVYLRKGWIEVQQI